MKRLPLMLAFLAACSSGAGTVAPTNILAEKDLVGTWTGRADIYPMTMTIADSAGTILVTGSLIYQTGCAFQLQGSFSINATGDDGVFAALAVLPGTGICQNTAVMTLNGTVTGASMGGTLSGSLFTGDVISLARQ